MAPSRKVQKVQQELCERYGVRWVPTSQDGTVRISRFSFFREPAVIHGFRRRFEGNFAGWYIWIDDQGKPPEQRMDIEPVSIVGVSQRLPKAIPFLGLPPGWQFSVTPEHQHAWDDAESLEP